MSLTPLSPPHLSSIVVFASTVALAGCGLSSASTTTTTTTTTTERIGQTTSSLTGGLSVLSGVNGTITTLATYPGGVAHPGINSVDIGAPGGTSVWHQLDYLPANVAGGWVRTYASHESGYCSQWYAGSPYYNGSKLIVVVYFYGADGTYLGWHRSAYQHVEPASASASDGWWKWNNASASQPAWSATDADIMLGSGASSGLYLGNVFAVPHPIYNGASGGLCTDGSHLHQEADGARASTLWVGKSVTQRYSDVQLFGIASGTPQAGDPPSAPTFDPPPVVINPPAEDPPAEDPPAEPSGDEKSAPTSAGLETRGASDRYRSLERVVSNEKPRVGEPSADPNTTLSSPLEVEGSEANASSCAVVIPRSTTRGGAFATTFLMMAVTILVRRRRR